MIEAIVSGIGVWGPGLPGWRVSRSVFRGTEAFVPRETGLPPPAILAATERRRAGAGARLAIAVAEEAARDAGIPAGSLAAVFASSNGDGALLNRILETLAGPDPVLSPTEFHNSVHNAAAGYWSIGVGSLQPIDCIACHDSTFSAALLKAMAQVVVEDRAVLLCVYDLPIPGPLGLKRETSCAFGAALVLSPGAQDAGWGRIASSYEAARAEPEGAAPRLPVLRPLFLGNAAAHALRLLEALARGEPDSFNLAFLDGRLRIDVKPCSTMGKSAI